MTTAIAGCLFCRDGCEVCSPNQQLPSWFRVGKYTPAYQIDNAKLGKHPFGKKLNGHGYCETCAFLRKNGRITCTKFERDVRVSWKACEEYEDNPW